jgi:hypothetical protein
MLSTATSAGSTLLPSNKRVRKECGGSMGFCSTNVIGQKIWGDSTEIRDGVL